MRRFLPLLLILSACYSAEDLNLVGDAVVSGEYVVGLADHATEEDVRAAIEALDLELVDARGSDRLAMLRDAGERDATEVLEALGQVDVLAFAESQVRYELLFEPNDFGTYLWGLNNDGSNGGIEDMDVGAFEAWDIATGAGVVVAVIDTGLDVDHPDLKPNLWVNEGEVANNGIDDDGNGYIDDVHGYDFVSRDGDPNDNVGHGTHVAGTIAAAANDGYGVPGLAFGSRVMGLKLLDVSSGGGAYTAAEAINYAVNEGAQVINASWGSYGYSTALRNAINYARSRGVVFVAAAGNEANNNDNSPLYPASYEVDNVISVAASDRSDRLASFSNYGQNVDLAAPGVEIVSTWIGRDGWTWQDGTSMASPHVAAAAAVVREAAPHLTPAETRQLFMQTGARLRSGEGRIGSGARLDLAAALHRIVGSPSDQEDPEEEDPQPLPEPPSAWTYVPFPIESPHPYANNWSGQIAVDAPEGTTEIKLHFARIDVESGYDFVVVRDTDGNKLAEWTGDVGAVESEALPGDEVRLFLFTDGSVTEWGLKLDGFSWR
jgi:thermitase